MSESLQKVQQRAVQYWFVDGLAELSMGVLFLLLAVLFWAQGVWFNSALGNLVFFLVAFGCAYVVRWGMQRIKEHSTYPRTGYVAYKKSGPGMKRYIWAAVAFAVLLTALQFFLIVRGLNAPAWMPAIEGLILAFIFTMTAYRSSLARFYILAAFGLLNGGGLALSGLGDFTGAAILSGMVGLVLLVFGGLTRRAYLHENPQLPEEPASPGGAGRLPKEPYER